ncbi:hypothetical protein PTKIN_Ptkin09bG0031300 [Pterospermum kingtungense]
MSSFIMSRCDEDEIHVSHQMEEVYQVMLLKRFDYEKRKFFSPVDAIFEANATAACFLDSGLLGLSALLESDLKYSLTYSTNPPQSFVPHQKLLWLLDAWTSVNAVHAKVSSFVLEMWFWWHSLLWSECPASDKNFSIIDSYDVPLPHVLVQPVRTASVAKTLQSTHDIKEFSMHCMKFKVAACFFWQISSLRTNIPSFLFSTACSLFQQEESIGVVSLLIALSSHQSLKSLIHLLIEPLLRRLYLNCLSAGDYLI